MYIFNIELHLKRGTYYRQKEHNLIYIQFSERISMQDFKG
jgi:hypothetical protein